MGIDVLLVEDGPGDIRLTKEAFRAVNPDVRIHVAIDGVEALAFLSQEGDHANSPRPDLILLDLNLPRVDGREVLKHIRSNAALEAIPTVILSTSNAPSDINESYELQANSYLSKPVQYDVFESVVRAVNEFWFERAKLPRGRQGKSAFHPDAHCGMPLVIHKPE